MPRQILDSRGNPTVEAEVTYRKWYYGKSGCTFWSFNWQSMKQWNLRDGDKEMLI